ncbi:MAG: hypothetical protein ABI808_04770 [Pseudonocardiales bacterium]
MSDVPVAATIIEGHVGRKTSNALKMSFRDGTGDPFAVAVQGAADGKGRKLGVLFGFKNGGVGNHVLTYNDGTTVSIASREGAPTVFTQGGDGVGVATVHRGETSTALRAGGGELFRFAPDPEEARTFELFRIIVTTPTGEPVGRLDVMRRATGWTLARAVDAAWDTYLWWDHAGQSLPIPVLGTRLSLQHPVSGIDRDVLLGACVDLAIGLRPYIAAMS